MKRNKYVIIVLKNTSTKTKLVVMGSRTIITNKSMYLSNSRQEGKHGSIWYDVTV